MTDHTSRKLRHLLKWYEDKEMQTSRSVTSTADVIADMKDVLDDDGAPCMTCQGWGYEECEDVNSSEGCWESDCDGSYHTCPNCRGSGDARDQRFW